MPVWKRKGWEKVKLLREENKAFFQKDAVSIWSDPPIRTALVAMPLVFVIAVPVIFLAMIYVCLLYTSRCV